MLRRVKKIRRYRLLKRGEVIIPETDQIKGGVYKRWVPLFFMGKGNTYNHAWHKIRRRLPV